MGRGSRCSSSGGKAHHALLDAAFQGVLCCYSGKFRVLFLLRAPPNGGKIVSLWMWASVRALKAADAWPPTPPERPIAPDHRVLSLALQTLQSPPVLRP